MRTGAIISGAGHLVLIVWALIAGLFHADPPPPITTASVSVMTGAEFAALTLPTERTPPVADSAEPVAPETPQEADVPDTPAPERPPETQPAPRPATVQEPDTAPDVSQIEPLPQVDVDPTVPQVPDPPDAVAGATLELDPSRPPKPTAAPRVAPEALPEPSPEADTAETVQEAVQPDERIAATEPEEEQQATAPEAQTTEIVTEAEEPGGTVLSSAAPVTSIRPPARPNRPTPAVQPTPEPEPQTPAPEPETTETASAEPEPAPSSAINDALEQALESDSGAQTPSAPSGPPMSQGERDALRVSVQRCWNVGALSSEALRVTVVVGVSMQQDGKIVQGSVRMLEASGGSDAAARQAYEAARRAIIRCGSSGFPLPADKYSQWREIEMVFNPNGMRLR
ncbi:MAG: energy transducer TonB [Pseudomonadota bacterium]